jgi:hypothetical protein
MSHDPMISSGTISKRAKSPTMSFAKRDVVLILVKNGSFNLYLKGKNQFQLSAAVLLDKYVNGFFRKTTRSPPDNVLERRKFGFVSVMI